MRRCRSRYTPQRLYLWQLRRAWLSLGVTCLLMGGGVGALALVHLHMRAERLGELKGFWVPSPPARVHAVAPDMASLHDEPLPPLELPEPTLPVQLPELPMAVLPQLPPSDATLLDIAEPDFPQPPPAPQPPRRVARARASSAAPAPVAAAAPAPAPPPAAEQGQYTPPAYRNTPLPPYPAGMRQSRLQGSVRLRIHLDAEGKPLRVEIAGSSGHAEFDNAARSWVLSRWEFTPALRDGRPVPGTVVTRVQFVLN